MGHSTLRTLTSHLYCQNQQVQRVQRWGRTWGHALACWKHVWALLFPGITRNKPFWAATVPAWPHSFAVVICPWHGCWMLTSLTLGVQGPALGPSLPQVLHATRSLLSSGTRTRCCPMGYVQASFIIPLGSMMPPFGPREGFQLGACGLALLSLAVVPLANPVLPRPSRDWCWSASWFSWLDLSFLSSSHSTFQSILGTMAAQLQPAVVLTPGSLFHRTVWYCCGFVFFECSLSLSLLTLQKYLCSFALSFDLLF